MPTSIRDLAIDTQRHEWLRCLHSPAYFTANFIWIYNATERDWIPFTLWPAQLDVLDRMEQESKLVILKARQLGISWLSLAYALWLLVFMAPATILIFSLKEGEAIELLSRLKGMYQRLPTWMRARIVVKSSDTYLELSTGSRALAFSTKGGRSYTGSLALVDEADFIPDLSTFLNGVKPTIDAGGKLFLISTSDKKRPVSTFKNLYRAARKLATNFTNDTNQTLREIGGIGGKDLGEIREIGGKTAGDYAAVFLPWHARPGRTAEWHDKTKAEMFAQRGTHDDFYAEYPATAEEALAPEQLDRRLPFDWLKLCIDERPRIVLSPLHPSGPHYLPDDIDAVPNGIYEPPALPGLQLYELPDPDSHYVIGADPAEGNPNSDDSAAVVLHAASWAEVATLTGKFEPGVFGSYLDQMATYYNGADVLPERNNHGHTLIRALLESGKCRVLSGYDGKPGWLTNIKGKPLLYDLTAQAIKDAACRIRSPETASQLASIEASTLSAPEGLHDDRATAFALAIAALASGTANAAASSHSAPPLDAIERMDRSKEW
jgi:hypothetical protein